MNKTRFNIHAIFVFNHRWDQLKVKVQDTVQSMFAGELIGRYPFLVPAYLSTGFKMIKAANPPDEPKLMEPFISDMASSMPLFMTWSLPSQSVLTSLTDSRHFLMQLTL